MEDHDKRKVKLNWLHLNLKKNWGKFSLNRDLKLIVTLFWCSMQSSFIVIRMILRKCYIWPWREEEWWGWEEEAWSSMSSTSPPLQIANSSLDTSSPPVPLSLPVCMYNCTHPLSLHVIADVRQCHRLDPALVKKIVKRDPDGGGCRGAPCGQPTGTSRLSPNNKPASSSSSSLDARTFCSWQAWIPSTAPPKSCIQADFSV